MARWVFKVSYVAGRESKLSGVSKVNVHRCLCPPNLGVCVCVQVPVLYCYSDSCVAKRALLLYGVSSASEAAESPVVEQTASSRPVPAPLVCV